MLFKTISAFVYGIDAHLVEVEVDVGSLIWRPPICARKVLEIWNGLLQNYSQSLSFQQTTASEEGRWWPGSTLIRESLARRIGGLNGTGSCPMLTVASVT